MLDDTLVVSDAVSAEALTHVAVQIDGIHETHLFLLLGDHLDGGLIDFSIDCNAVAAHRSRPSGLGLGLRLSSRGVQSPVQIVEALLHLPPQLVCLGDRD